MLTAPQRPQGFEVVMPTPAIPLAEQKVVKEEQ
jgi:hypothetical protein